MPILSWEDIAGGVNTVANLESGVTHDMGQMTASISFLDQSGGSATAFTSDENMFVGSQGFDADSSLRLYGTGGDGSAADPTITTTIDFSANSGTGLSDNVSDVAFRINDLDVGTSSDQHVDILTIRAYDANGNEVPVTLTETSSMTQIGNTVSGSDRHFFPDDQEASLLVEINGPVSQIVIEYANGDITDQQVNITDVHYSTLVDDITVDGTSGDDVMLVGFVDGDNDTIDGADGDNDIILGYAGDDSIDGGLGNDSIFGGSGSDEIDGGSGNDTIFGGLAPGVPSAPVREVFEWNDQANFADEGNASGFTQDTGNVDVTFSIVNDNSTNIEFETASGNVSGIDTGGLGAVDDNSGLALETNSSSDTATVAFVFSSDVENVDFRINDVDFDSQVTVRAYDTDGNQIPITLTGGSDLSLSDTGGASGNDTATSNGGGQSPSGSDYSVLVEIAGPVARIEVDHNNTGGDSSHVQITDIYFDASSGVVDNGLDGDDTIDGGIGNDIIYGEAGNDVLTGGTGNNELFGGSGDDVFIGGAGADTFQGNAGQDNLDYSNSGAAVNVNLTTGALSGGDADNDTIAGGIDGVIGSDFDDVLTGFNQQGTTPADTFTNELFGGAGNDVISGLDGNDLLEGGDDNDTITGGAGADSISGGADRDLIIGGTDGDTIDGGSAGGVDDFDTLDLTGQGPFRIINQVVDGNGNGTDGTVEFLDGSGVPTGESFTFTEIEEILGDRVAGPVDGTSGNDVITPTSGAGGGVFVDAQGDSVDGIDGDDDIINGFAGDDTIDGGAGADQIFGGADADTILLDDGEFDGDVIAGGEAGDDVDTVNTTDVAEDVTVTFTGNEAGTVEGDTSGDEATFTEIEAIETGAGDDTVDGSVTTAGIDVTTGDGSDALYGGRDDDTITVGAGDNAEGGHGDDVFTIDVTADNDTTGGGAATVNIVGGETGEANQPDNSDTTNDNFPGAPNAFGDVLDLSVWPKTS